MRTSESIVNIGAALLAAQQQITFAAKTADNPYYNSTYADLGEVIHAIKPALNAAGVVFVQTPSPSQEGDLHLTTRLIHAPSGEWIEDELVMPLAKQDPQGYGSAITYARRYSLAAITGLYQADDDGNAASAAPPPARNKQPVQARPAKQQQKAEPAIDENTLLNDAADAAGKGSNAYRAFWMKLTPREKNVIGEKRHDDFKTVAAFNDTPTPEQFGQEG
jgi:hypothetical protein